MLFRFGLVLGMLSIASFAESQETRTEPKPAVLQVASDPPDALRTKTDSAAKRLRKAHALTSTATTADDIGAIIELCEEVLVEMPSEGIAAYGRDLAAWAYNRRGELLAASALKLYEKGDEAEADRLDADALADFDSALRHDPNKWKALHNRGVSRAVQGDVIDALADFEAVIQLRPDYASAWYNRAEIFVRQGKYQDAADDYSEVLKLEASDAGAFVGRGDCWLRLGKLVEAQADFERALKVDPKFAPAVVGRGDALVAQGQWDQAGAQYERAIKLDPKLARAFRGIAWLTATCPDEQFFSAELALTAAQKAIELVGDADWTYLDALAAAQASSGEYEAALATQQKALRIAPVGERQALAGRLSLYGEGKSFRQRTTAANPASVKMQR